jgi:hypothetical protein
MNRIDYLFEDAPKVSFRLAKVVNLEPLIALVIPVALRPSETTTQSRNLIIH